MWFIRLQSQLPLVTAGQVQLNRCDVLVRKSRRCVILPEVTLKTSSKSHCHSYEHPRPLAAPSSCCRRTTITKITERQYSPHAYMNDNKACLSHVKFWGNVWVGEHRCSVTKRRVQEQKHTDVQFHLSLHEFVLCTSLTATSPPPLWEEFHVCLSFPCF